MIVDTGTIKYYNKLERLSFFKEADLNEAKYLRKINLELLRKEHSPEEGELPKDFYARLNALAEQGPAFSEQAIHFVEKLTQDKLPDQNRKVFVKWIAEAYDDDRKLLLDNYQEIFDWINFTNWTNPDGTPINLEDLTLEEAIEAQAVWHRSLHANKKELKFDNVLGPYQTKNVVYSFPNGYTIVKVPIVDRDVEGQLMGHCVGTHYAKSRYDILSLRDSQNLPHVTIRADEAKNIQEIKGKENKVPDYKYADYVRMWLEESGYNYLDCYDFKNLPITKSWSLKLKKDNFNLYMMSDVFLQRPDTIDREVVLWYIDFKYASALGGRELQQKFKEKYNIDDKDTEALFQKHSKDYDYSNNLISQRAIKEFIKYSNKDALRMVLDELLGVVDANYIRLLLYTYLSILSVDELLEFIENFIQNNKTTKIYTNLRDIFYYFTIKKQWKDDLYAERICENLINLLTEKPSFFSKSSDTGSLRASLIKNYFLNKILETANLDNFYEKYKSFIDKNQQAILNVIRFEYEIRPAFLFLFQKIMSNLNPEQASKVLFDYDLTYFPQYANLSSNIFNKALKSPNFVFKLDSIYTKTEGKEKTNHYLVLEVFKLLYLKYIRIYLEGHTAERLKIYQKEKDDCHIALFKLSKVIYELIIKNLKISFTITSKYIPRILEKPGPKLRDHIIKSQEKLNTIYNFIFDAGQQEYIDFLMRLIEDDNNKEFKNYFRSYMVTLAKIKKLIINVDQTINKDEIEREFRRLSMYARALKIIDES